MKLSTTVYLTEEQLDALKALSKATRVPQAEFIRTAIDAYLAREDVRARLESGEAT